MSLASSNGIVKKIVYNIKVREKLMKAAVFYENKNIRVETRDFSLNPASNEVMIRVKSTGICGTDQQIYKGEPGSAKANLPIILGHEFAGEVVEVGNDVK